MFEASSTALFLVLIAVESLAALGLSTYLMADSQKRKA